MPHRRLVLALALTVAAAVLAALVLLVPAPSFGSPIAISAAVESPPPPPPPPPAPGPSAELARAREYREIADAVAADQLRRFYEWAAAQPPPAAPTPKKLSASSPPAASPAPRGSGDASTAIAAHFGDIYDQAWGVSGCESGHDPGAISPGGGNWGLFQINRPAHEADFVQFANALLDDEGAPPDDPRRTWAGGVLNADLNAAYARKLYNGSGWGPWSCAWAA